MIDWDERLVMHPMLTAAAGAGTAGMGVLEKFYSDLPAFHEFISDGTMLLGMIACIIGIAVQIRNYQIKTIERAKAQREYDSDTYKMQDGILVEKNDERKS